MPRGGKREGAGRKPGSVSTTALVRAIEKQKRKAEQMPLVEDALDSLQVMRGCLGMAYTEIPEALKQVRDLAEKQDPKILLEAVRALRVSIVDCHTIAKDIAPYEHLRLAGEKPLDQDAAKGPPVLTLTAIEQAV